VRGVKQGFEALVILEAQELDWYIPLQQLFCLSSPATLYLIWLCIISAEPNCFRVSQRPCDTCAYYTLHTTTPLTYWKTQITTIVGNLRPPESLGFEGFAAVILR
jgi:hypothetical protein